MSIFDTKKAKCFFVYIIIFIFASPLVFAQPVADFTADTTQGCSTFPLLVDFESLATGNIDTYRWDFGDPASNASSSLRNPSYTYRAPGCYDVKLFVSGPDGEDSIIQTCFVEIFPEPTPEFILGENIGCAPLTITFQDSSIANSPGNITEWIWNFSDGSFSTEQNPTFTFLSPGSINLTLSVTNSNGCRGVRVFNDVVNVLEGPDLDFTADVPSACSAPVNVTINNNTVENGAGELSYSWLFPSGNPAISDEADPPVITYSTPGSFDVTLITSSENGCQDTLVRSGFVGVGNVTADFSVNSTTICVGDSVAFTNNSQGGVTSFQWDFGDGGTSSERDPLYTYSAAGTYTVSLTANNPDGCGNAITQENFITVVENPVASFTVNETSTCFPSTIFEFTNESTGGNIFEWNFGDGTTSNAQNPTHTYGDFGDYQVSLTVTNASGCVDSFSLDSLIRIIPPAINFEADNRMGCSPLTVNFTDLTEEEDIVTRLWILPGSDIGTSTEENPTALYETPGDYDVSLVIETAEGCIDTLVRANHIEMGDSVSAEFEAMDTLICIRDPAMFTAFLPDNPDTTRWEFAWDFEYEPDSGFNEMSTEQNPSHTYSDTGTYSVALVIKDFGCTDTIFRLDYITVLAPRAQFGLSDTAVCDLPTTIQIQDQSVIGEATSYQWFLDDFNNLYSTDSMPPPLSVNTVDSRELILIVSDAVTGCADTVASLIAVSEADATIDVLNGDVGCRPYTANFNLGNNPVSSVLWDFGNGLTSTAFNPSVTYEDTGTYTVNLTVTNSVGCQASETGTITVTGPMASFNADTLTGCTPLPVQFEDLSTPYPGTTITNWLWEFGDGTTDNRQNPDVVYTEPLEYTVNLTVTDSDGCTDLIERVQFIDATFPIPDFEAENDTTCLGVPVQFIDSSEGKGLLYEWDFGDGSPISTASNPAHDYAAPGLYTVSLTLTDINGCVDSITKENFVLVEEFIADFDGDPRSQFCPPMFTEFENLTVGNAAGFEWEFGDGNVSVLEDPANIYLLAGNYDVKLIATHISGCQDSITKENFIQLDGPEGEFVIDPLRACLGDTVTLTLISEKALTVNADYRDGVVESQQAAGVIGVPDTTVFRHVYQDPRQYSVLFTIQDAVGCAVDLTVPDSIVILPPPIANFSPFDTLACIPTAVPFTDLSIPNDSTNPIVAWNWDFGNGDTDTVQNPFYAFTDPGTFTVQLGIEDSIGCVDSISTSIQVSPGIIADFVATDSFGCSPFQVDFIDNSTVEPAISWLWDFGDGDSSTLSNPSHIYLNDGTYTVSLAVQDALGCSDTIVNPEYINLSRPSTSISVSATIGCSPETITFFAEDVVSDTTISTYDWCVSDSLRGFVGCFRTQGAEDSLNFDFQQPGTYTVYLEVGDVFGCTGISDSIIVRISERIIPPPIIIETVSVEDERSIFLSYIPYTETDFVSYIILRSEDNGPFIPIDTLFEQDISTYLDLNSDLSTSDHTYCYKVLVLNTCNELSNELLTEEHCTILLSTIPGEDEIELNWTPYVGYEVEQYEIFRLDPDNPSSLISLGVVDGNVTSFVDTSTFCRDFITYRILAIGTGLSNQASFSNFSTDAPIHLPPAEGVDVLFATVVDDEFIRLEWEEYNGYLPLSFIVERSEDGVTFDTLTTVPISTLTLDDFEVAVDNISYTYRLSAIDECGDVTLLGNVGTNILLGVNFSDQGRTPVLSWNAYQQWPNGVRSYEIEIFNEALGIWELIAILPGNERIFIDTDTELEQAEYCYRVTAVEAGGLRSTSLSNEECIIFGPRLFVPNAFTPNGDGDNDIFTLAAPNVESGVFNIFDRWGKLIFTSLNIDNGWDGTFNGVSVPEGVYVYVLDAIGEDGTQFQRSGTITLIR